MKFVLLIIINPLVLQKAQLQPLVSYSTRQSNLTLKCHRGGVMIHPPQLPGKHVSCVWEHAKVWGPALNPLTDSQLTLINYEKKHFEIDRLISCQ